MHLSLIRRPAGCLCAIVALVLGLIAARTPARLPAFPGAEGAESLQGVPVPAGHRLVRITELKNRISKASVCSGCWSGSSRHHQDINWLARFKWKPVQDEFSMLTDRSLSLQ